MKFIWVKNGYKINTRVIFRLQNQKAGDILKICAVDFYRVFLDGKFRCFGPERTAAGFSRPKTISVKGANIIEIEVEGYNATCYACDFQKPFFGAELYLNGELVYNTEDFVAVTPNSFVQERLKFSGQRGFVENVDFCREGETARELIEVASPRIIEEIGDTAEYIKYPFNFVGKENFKGFGSHKRIYAETKEDYFLPDGAIDPIALENDFSSGKYVAFDYFLDVEHTGFIQLDFSLQSESDIYLVMDEYLLDGRWLFRRSGCNDFIKIHAGKGDWKFLSFEPYSLKYLKILVCGKAEVSPSLISYENNNPSCIRVRGDKRLKSIFDAAENTFRQNAMDIFMDCPSRERAGWLCDTFFTAKSEELFFGNNKIERAFLENILISTTEELDARMLPKCFPSQHKSNHYIPNWAMWFVIELKDYFMRTGDKSLVDMAKDRVYALIDFFDDYINELGLLENLESWVFIEWSVCNTPEYIKGVNFPSNMLYAYMLDAIAYLYGDDSLKKRSSDIFATVQKLSFNGKFFVDNAVRDEKGRLVCISEHVSETCQYYALYMGLCPSEDYKKHIINEFGPARKDAYPEIGKSNMFIGNYLRLLWLNDIGEYDRVINEIEEYFSLMAEKTGTLWEHNTPFASCNHGFASVVSVILLRAMFGYLGVKDNKPVFEKGFKPKDYGIEVEFNY